MTNGPTQETGLSIGLLGTLEVRRGIQTLAVGGTKQRTLLALLALDPGRVVSTDRLVSALWGESEPPTALNALQVYASNLRRVLGEMAGRPILRWQKPGYVLDVAVEAVDVGRFEGFAAAARARHRAGDLPEASRLFGLALGQWRGAALADVADEPFAAGAIARLESERLVALEEHFQVDLALGRHADLVGPLQQLVAEHALRESARGLLMLALYRSGRQAEALETYREARVQLAAQLGLDPGPELRDLEGAILAQSPTLEHKSAASAVGRWDPTISAGPGEEAVTAWLVSPEGERLPLDKTRVLVGRADDCHVVIADPLSSRRHAMIRLTGGVHEIIDLDSTNGTRVNDLELGPNQAHALTEHDDILIGRTRLRYLRGAGKPATDPAPH
ncbi:MAG: family transcriptional regulator, regulator of embCAB operon [Frankiales bacterium]|nr:family transcriptional regulator, regulator of embCAB operon [Frankiales bacterium]